MITVNAACKIAIDNVVKKDYLRGVVEVVDIGDRWLFLVDFQRNLVLSMAIAHMQSTRRPENVRNFLSLLWRILSYTIIAIRYIHRRFGMNINYKKINGKIKSLETGSIF